MSGVKNNDPAENSQLASEMVLLLLMRMTHLNVLNVLTVKSPSALFGQILFLPPS